MIKTIKIEYFINIWTEKSRLRIQPSNFQGFLGPKIHNLSPPWNTTAAHRNQLPETTEPIAARREETGTLCPGQSPGRQVGPDRHAEEPCHWVEAQGYIEVGGQSQRGRGENQVVSI